MGSRTLAPAASEAIYRLWDKLADYPKAQIDEACTYLMQSLCRMIGADNAGWAGIVRMQSGPAARKDVQNGWRVKVALGLKEMSKDQNKRLQELIRQQEIEPCMACCATARLAGKFRVHRMHDGFVDFEKMRSTWHFRVLHEVTGLDDRIWVGFPLNSDAESFFLFDKCRTKARFSSEDAGLVGSALRGIRWFHRDLLQSHGLLVATAPLSPGHRRMLFQLLSEKPEREIAAALGLTPTTVHTYAKDIYAKFGVAGRAGLGALWLSGVPPERKQDAASPTGSTALRR